VTLFGWLRLRTWQRGHSGVGDGPASGGKQFEDLLTMALMIKETTSAGLRTVVSAAMKSVIRTVR